MPASENALVTISEACRILGVSEPTLRQWSDEGTIQTFVTPGGHRRYSKAELKKFISFHQKMLGTRDLAEKLGDTVVQHRQIAISLMQSVPGYQKLDRDTQQQFAILGRSFLESIIKYITEPANKKETLADIKKSGYRFGELTSGLDMPLIDSIQAFIKHRDPIVSTTTTMMKKGEAASRRFVDAIPLVDQAMDEALVSLVTAYQKHKNDIPPQIS